MPTDRQPTEQEMAWEAISLLDQWQRPHRTAGHITFADDNIRRARSIKALHGPCPGFWGEVLAAVRVLAGDPHLHIERDRWGYSRVATFTSAGKRDYLTHGMAGEPAAILAAILAALRAVVGAADA